MIKMSTAKKLSIILFYPVLVEIVRFAVFNFMGGAFAQIGLLDKLTIAITVALYAWIGWRTWVFVHGGFKMVLSAAFLFSLFLLVLSSLAAVFNLGGQSEASTVTFLEAAPGLIISFVLFYLPVALLTTLVSWYVSRNFNSRKSNKSKAPGSQ